MNVAVAITEDSLSLRAGRVAAVAGAACGRGR